LSGKTFLNLFFGYVRENFFTSSLLRSPTFLGKKRGILGEKIGTPNKKFARTPEFLCATMRERVYVPELIVIFHLAIKWTNIYSFVI
jgi:hypothetical protein